MPPDAGKKDALFRPEGPESTEYAVDPLPQPA
jgi:hypothetical protein